MDLIELLPGLARLLSTSFSITVVVLHRGRSKLQQSVLQQLAVQRVFSFLHISAAVGSQVGAQILTNDSLLPSLTQADRHALSPHSTLSRRLSQSVQLVLLVHWKHFREVTTKERNENVTFVEKALSLLLNARRTYGILRNTFHLGLTIRQAGSNCKQKNRGIHHLNKALCSLICSLGTPY